MRDIDRLLRDAGALVEKRAADPAILDQLAAYADDPTGFALNVLGVSLWEEQGNLLELPLRHRNSTVVAAHNLGKSFSLAVLVLWWCYARRGAVVTICPVEAQLRSLWRDVRTSWFESLVKLPGEILEAGLRVSDSPPIFAISRTTTSGLRLKGLHARVPLLVLCDESDALEATGDGTWAAALTLGGGTVDRFLAAGNPTGKWGVWYERCTDPTWGHLQLSALDHPNVTAGEPVLPTKVSREWVEQIARLYGTDSAEYQRQVLGQFSDDRVEQLVQAEWLDRSYALHAAGTLRAGEPLRVGIDPAFGGDLTAVAVVEGGHVSELAAWTEKDTMLTVSRLVELFLRHNVARDAEHQPRAQGPGREATVLIDVAYGGIVLYDLLKQAGWPVTKYWSNGAPEVSDEVRRAAKYDPTLWDGIEPWLNRRAQAYCTLAKLLKEGRLAVPRDSALAEELLTTHRLLDAKGSVMIEGKGQLRGRLGRSPDRADALSMAAGTVEPIETQCTVGGLPLSF